MSKLNWNRLGFFILGSFLGQMLLGGIFGAVKKVG